MIFFRSQRKLVSSIFISMNMYSRNNHLPSFYVTREQVQYTVINTLQNVYGAQKKNVYKVIKITQFDIVSLGQYRLSYE